MKQIDYWFSLKNKKRIVIKIGSSSLIHKNTGAINYNKIEKLTRLICDLKNMGKEVILVSSGAVAIGRKELKIKKKPLTLDEKQACAAIGQSTLMTIYSKIFKEYNEKAAQVLITKIGLQMDHCCENISNTIEALLKEANSNIKDIKVYIGSCIKEKNYCYDRYPKWATNTKVWKNNIKKKDNYYYIDLISSIKNQLYEQGIAEKQIKVSPYDTYTHPNYYSHTNEVRNEAKPNGQNFVGCFYKEI